MTDYERSGRSRGKPQREIYTPGSGPLRKSAIGGGETADIKNGGSARSNGVPPRSIEVNRITEELIKISMNSSSSSSSSSLSTTINPSKSSFVNNPLSRHQKNITSEFISTAAATAKSSPSDVAAAEDQNAYNLPVKVVNIPRNVKTDDSCTLPKQIDRRKREKKRSSRDNKVNTSDNKCSDSEKEKAKEFVNVYNNENERASVVKNRLRRHESEPPESQNRNRNSRLDVVGQSGSGWNKSGGSGSGGGYIKPLLQQGNNNIQRRNNSNSNTLGKTKLRPPPTFDSLPPRLQKKYMADNGLELSDLRGGSLGMAVENSSWDGNTLTFTGKADEHLNRPPRYEQRMPRWASRRGRGRGKLDRDEDDQQPQQRFTQRPPASVGVGKNTSSNSGSYKVDEKENQSRGGSPINNIKLADGFIVDDTKNMAATDHLDWADEVERYEEQDKNRTTTGHTQKESFFEPSVPPAREKKRKKKRSVSGDHPPYSNHQYRRSSIDNLSNCSRSNSIERNWRSKAAIVFDDTKTVQSSCSDNRSRHSSLDRRDNNNRHRQRNRKNSTGCRHEVAETAAELQRGSVGGKVWTGWKTGNNYKKDESSSTNWRLEQTSASQNKDSGNSSGDTPNKHAAGILFLPQPLQREQQPPPPPTTSPKGAVNSTHTNTTTAAQQRRLFDPSNPDRPIVVPYMKAAPEFEAANYHMYGYPLDTSKMLVPANDAMAAARPIWYNPYTENFQKSHNPQLIRAIEQADCELHYLLSTCELLYYWDRMQQLRYFLKESLKRMLLTDLRFCQSENVEQHLWKVLYYNVIELFRKLICEHPNDVDKYKQALLTIIEEGTNYYEKLLNDLERTNRVKFETFLNAPICVREGLGYTGLALVAAQKIYLCLGDLARYKEQANDSCNYGVARQWYMKAHQINPKNGRPYNQLAILAMYTKRKLDAVYYYMRCLMSSNPLLTARESLISLFDDNRKKYEAVDRKRKEERARKEREKMKEKEGSGSGYRREIWIHPGGGKNVHRTTSTCAADFDSQDEELYSASNIEVNKRFCMSYLLVHGKIFTKIGLETLNETCVQMLREFRALLQHSPIPLNSTRFIQLFALNMFAIEITQPKGDVNKVNDGGCYRSALQESALVLSLQMFNLLLEKFVKLLQEHINSPDPAALIVPPDCQAILPALKVWCDWLMTHVEIWNPPPSCQDYKVGPAGDCWSRIASLVNLLEKIDYRRDLLSTQEKEGFDLVYLPEDATLSGFTPLMANSEDPIYAHKDSDVELAQISLRVHKILFFGSVFLCGLDPPVLKLHKVETGLSEYISVVDTPGGSQEHSEVEMCMESISSSEESDDSGKATGVDDEEGSERAGPSSSSVHSQLIRRKGVLESRHRRLQARHHSIQKVISQSEVMTEMEIRPHDLVPDTNCFIDCLSQIEALLKILPHQQHPYVFMVPLVVVNELEGLSRGCKPSQSALHSAMVRETARVAMNILQNKHPALRCVTTRGTVLNSSTFIIEEDLPQEMKNDDKILTTCLNLCRNRERDEVKEGGRRKLYREVVLLTEDKSLRLKAIARDMPVRALPDFIRWAGLG